MKSNTFKLLLIIAGIIIAALCCLGCFLFMESQAMKDAEIEYRTMEQAKKDSLNKIEQAELLRIANERETSIKRENEASAAREKATEDRSNELNEDITQQTEYYTANSTTDLALLTTGQWYANESDTDTDWWYTYMADGTGRLKVSVPNFNTPISATFTWSISNGVLSVRWDSDFAALAGARGWNGEIRKLNNEIMEIYDNRSYSREVYKHIR